ncbi:MAG TPA: PHP domain-containing protein [Vicinamibacterales bacterium]
MIDLHTHTTASDGRCSPAELVERAARAGVTVLAVADHDTVAGCAAAAAACAAAGIEFVTGTEITAVVEEKDVHVLGYFFDRESASLQTFLAEQRRRRIDRIHEIARRLAQQGMPLDVEAILGPGVADSSKAAGRPWIARAMVAAGYVTDVSEAFEKWLTPGRPAFVPRIGAAPAEVFARIHEAGGIASLAHPGPMRRDERIPGYADAGLDAIEAHHSDHEPADVERYLALAARLNLAVSGGSDFHADDEHGGGGPGSVSLPRERFEALKERHLRRA